MSTVQTGSKSKAKGKNGSLPTMAPSGPVADDSTVHLPVKLIEIEEGFNARTEIDDIEGLAATIKREGQISPVEVRKTDEGKYRLISGFRRYYAISLPVEDGGLGRDTIKATILKGEVSEDTDVEDKYRNLIENVQRDNLSPLDLARRCHELSLVEASNSGKERGASARVASRLGKSASYIGNLVTVWDRISPKVKERWALEVRCRREDRVPTKEEAGAGSQLLVCSTDRLVKWSPLTHAEQEIEMFKAMGIQATAEQLAKAEADAKAAAEARGQDPTKEPRTPEPERAKKGELKAALKAATDKRNMAENPTAQAKADGVIAGLRFALGLSDGIIKGFYSGKEDASDE